MRSLHPDTAAALKQPVVRLLVLARFHLASGVVPWHTGFAPIDLDGYTYTGSANLAAIGNLTEAAVPRPGTMQVTLSGIDPAVVASFTATPFVNRPALIHLATVTADLSVIGAPFLLFGGATDTPEVYLGKTATVKISIRSRLADWERPLISRYTHEEQQRRHPGDNAFIDVEQLAHTEIFWPGKG